MAFVYKYLRYLSCSFRWYTLRYLFFLLRRWAEFRGTRTTGTALMFVQLCRKDDTFEITRPFIPLHYEILFSRQTRSQKFYKSMMSTTKIQQKHEVKWNLNLPCSNNWDIIYKSWFKCIPDNKTIWLQYRILYRILSTNEYFYRLKISSSKLCILNSLNTLLCIVAKLLLFGTIWGLGSFQKYPFR